MSAVHGAAFAEEGGSRRPGEQVRGEAGEKTRPDVGRAEEGGIRTDDRLLGRTAKEGAQEVVGPAWVAPRLSPPAAGARPNHRVELLPARRSGVARSSADPATHLTSPCPADPGTPQRGPRCGGPLPRLGSGYPTAIRSAAPRTGDASRRQSRRSRATAPAPPRQPDATPGPASPVPPSRPRTTHPCPVRWVHVRFVR